jgi:hypothetical protein
MSTNDTKNRRNRTDVNLGSGPMDQSMFGMMKKCCTGQDGFPDCSGMMKGMREAMKKQSCCKPKKDAAEFKGRKK